MAIHEGLCPNCGSLMRVNDENETTYCIFCWAPADSQEAIRLMENSEGHEFENKSYPEPAPEEKMKVLSAQGLGGVNVMPALHRTPSPAQEKRREGKLTPREKVALQNKPLVKPYCSKKHRLAILGGVAAFLLVVAAIALPLYFTREGKKKALKAELPAIVSYASDENRVDIQRQKNQLITLVSPERTTEEEATSVFNKYAEAYAEIYGISLDKAKSRIEVRLMDQQDGGYSITYHDSNLKVTDLK